MEEPVQNLVFAVVPQGGKEPIAQHVILYCALLLARERMCLTMMV